MLKKKAAPQKPVFATGMRWLPVTEPAGSASFRKQLREHAEVVDANWHVPNPKEPGIVGFWRNPKRQSTPVHSFAVLAMRFATAAKATSAATLEDLNEHLPDLGMVLLMSGDSTSWKLAVVLDNSVVVDREDSLEVCLDQIKHVCNSDTPWVIYTDHNPDELLAELQGIQVKQIDWSELEAFVADDRSSILLPIPRSRTPLFAAAAISLMAVAAASWYVFVQQPQAERLARLAALDGDNTDAYVLAADAELKTGGWERADLVALIARLNELPIAQAGWHAKELTCEMATGSCKLQVSRAGGTTDGIVNGWNEFQFAPVYAQIDNAVLESSIQPKKTGWDRAQIQPNQKTQLELQPIAQQLINAGLQFKASEESKWAALDLDAVDPTAVLSRFQVEIGGPLYRAQEVLSLLPPSVLLSSLSINVTSVSAEAPQVGFLMKGFVYVK
jgi:hypothetical protein